MATSHLPSPRDARVPSHLDFPLSPLDALSQKSRKDSVALSAQSPIEGRRRDVPQASGRWQAPRGTNPREAEGGGRGSPGALRLATDVDAHGKGKGRVEEVQWAQQQQQSDGLLHSPEEDQFADPQHQDRAPPPLQLSPLRRHAFGDSVGSSVDYPDLRASSYSDFDADGSPVVPDFGSARSNSTVSSSQRNYRPNASASTPPGAIKRHPSIQRYPAIHADQEQETESLQGDRSTWHTDAYGQRDSMASFMGGIPGGRAMPRETTMSSMTMESADGDPFSYSVYESLPSPSRTGFLPDPNSPLPPPTSSPSSPTQSRPGPSSHQPPPPHTPSRNAPIVRIGPPSPDFLPNPHESQLWRRGDDLSVGLPSPPSSSMAGFGFLGGSPRTPDSSPSSAGIPSPGDKPSSGGRTRSHTLTKNFSRPFSERVADPGVVRSDSLESVDGGGHQGSSLGGYSSSLGHSSQGAHSTSSSWEGRVELEARYEHDRRTQAMPEGDQQSVVARGIHWKHVDRGMNSPAPFAGYSQPSGGPKSSSSPPRRARASASEGLSQPSYAGVDGYRLDSYYAPATPMLASVSSSGAARSPMLSPGPDRADREVQRPRTADSARNVLKKSRAPDPSPPLGHEEHGRRWMPFRSKSKGREPKSREIVDDDAGDMRFSTSPGRSRADPPSLAFSHELPPPNLEVNPDEIARRANEQDYEGRRAAVEADERVKSAFRLGFTQPIRGSVSSNGSTGRPGYGYGDEIERLDDEERTFAMPRSHSDTGPRRLDDKSSSSMPRPQSSNSLYSNYSFYSLPDDTAGNRSGQSSRQTSPATSTHPPPGVPPGVKFASSPAGVGVPASSTLAKAKAGFKKGNDDDLPVGEPVTSEDFLQLGIKYHEDGELERSAWYFEQSAKGGSGGGMLMYGLALRHGWGCKVNAELGFRYLQSAAETVVADLDRVVAGGTVFSKDEMPAKATKNELVLALHEIGTSFRFGWGVTKDKKMAVSYFKLSADLGDADAQSDLAFCYANGKGCKKDMKAAAKYYRMSVAQGGETFGLSWIYKPKYVDD